MTAKVLTLENKNHPIYIWRADFFRKGENGEYSGKEASCCIYASSITSALALMDARFPDSFVKSMVGEWMGRDVLVESTDLLKDMG